jgi:fatty acid desaturase
MNNPSTADTQKIKNIQQAIRSADRELRIKYPVLNHQNTIGLIICLTAFVGMISTGLAYIADMIPAWACIVMATVFASVSHELEHDLIHRLYFKKNAFIQNIMMAIVWIMRPNTVNPWYRRGIHFNHHKTSGTADDIEERVLGNGMQFGWKRILISLDGFLSISLRQKELRNMKDYNYFSFVLKGAPLAHIYVALLYSFLLFHGFDFINNYYALNIVYPEFTSPLISLLNIVAVVWVLPNALRALCLHNVTAVMHYYGDVDSLLKQCQVINHWAAIPFQIFCFNFGATHTLHHFVVSQPFYLRQMVAKDIYPVLKQNGVRFNDFDSLLRSNRFSKSADLEAGFEPACRRTC